MRTFISLDIPAGPVRDAIHEFMNNIERFEGIKTVDKELLHATLLFLGDRNEKEREDIKTAFTEACSGIPIGSFTCSVGGVGVFPNMNYIKVVWCGVKPKEDLISLHEYFREEIGSVNEREYVPHVTVGRVTYMVEDNKEGLHRLISETDRVFGMFQATDVRLNVSETAGSGVRYRELERCSL